VRDFQKATLVSRHEGVSPKTLVAGDRHLVAFKGDALDRTPVVYGLITKFTMDPGGLIFVYFKELLEAEGLPEGVGVPDRDLVLVNYKTDRIIDYRAVLLAPAPALLLTPEELNTTVNTNPERLVRVCAHSCTVRGQGRKKRYVVKALDNPPDLDALPSMMP
jgi:hypothetical protein